MQDQVRDKEHDAWLTGCKRVRDLSMLRKMLDRMLNVSESAA